jgi:hypothetical protein
MGGAREDGASGGGRAHGEKYVRVRRIKPSDHTLFYHATGLAIDDLVVDENQRYCRTQVGPSFRTIAVASRLSIPFLPSALLPAVALSRPHAAVADRVGPPLPPCSRGSFAAAATSAVPPTSSSRSLPALLQLTRSRLTTSFNSKVAGMGMGKGHERIDYFIKR